MNDYLCYNFCYSGPLEVQFVCLIHVLERVTKFLLLQGPLV